MEIWYLERSAFAEPSQSVAVWRCSDKYFGLWRCDCGLVSGFCTFCFVDGREISGGSGASGTNDHSLILEQSPPSDARWGMDLQQKVRRVLLLSTGRIHKTSQSC